MRKFLVSMIALVALLVCQQRASAHWNPASWYWYGPGPGYYGPMYYPGPAFAYKPYYYAPPPVVYYPRPVYYAPVFYAGPKWYGHRPYHWW